MPQFLAPTIQGERQSYGHVKVATYLVVRTDVSFFMCASFLFTTPV